MTSSSGGCSIVRDLGAETPALGAVALAGSTMCETVRTALQVSQRGLAVFDPEGRIAFMNARYATLLGLASDAIGQTLAEATRRLAAGLTESASDAALRCLEYLLLLQSKKTVTLTQELDDGRLLYIDHEPLASGGFFHILTESTANSKPAARSRHSHPIESDLRDALAKKQFELVYQPIIGVAPLRVAGFEALLRWRHPVHGTASPTQFISIAEEIGLIGAIGAWALEEACLQAASWPSDVKIAVNLSPAQLRCESFVETVSAAIKKANLDPTRLELEITENLFLEDSETVLAILRELRNMGLRIAVDDFGAGYSSLGYLRKFRFDKVKIDRMFVQDAGESDDCLAILRAVTGLCGSLGIETTVEGIETIEHMSAAVSENCDQMQGFLFSKPRRSSELAAMMAGFARRPKTV